MAKTRSQARKDNSPPATRKAPPKAPTNAATPKPAPKPRSDIKDVEDVKVSDVEDDMGSDIEDEEILPTTVLMPSVNHHQQPIIVSLTSKETLECHLLHYGSGSELLIPTI
jgi:hypothetical protein